MITDINEIRRFFQLRIILSNEKKCYPGRFIVYKNGHGNIFQYYFDMLCDNKFKTWISLKKFLKEDYFMTKKNKDYYAQEEISDLEELFRIIDEIKE